MTHPPTFAVSFRDDNPDATQRVGVYEQALQFTTLIDKLVDQAVGRFHLKDVLDRESTLVAMRIAQAAGEVVKGERRDRYRSALRAATDCAAILDIMARRGAIDTSLFEPARALITSLIFQLAHLAVK